MRVSTARLLALTSSLIAAAAVAAQNAPDGGALIQQVDRPPVAAPAPRAGMLGDMPAPLSVPDGATVTVESFRFAGNTLLDDAPLHAAVEPWVGRTLGYNELRAATQAVARAYRARGWIVRSYLPAQDVTEGAVTIQVVESSFGGTRVEAAGLARLSAGLPARYVAAQQRQGATLDARALDRALLLIDDLPGVAVSGALAAGESDRETVLLLRGRDTSLLDGSFSVDNGGARMTGAARVLLSAALQSPLHRGDALAFDAQYSEGTRYARTAYSMPVGSNGWRAGLNASWFGYELVAEEFAALGARGIVRTAGIDLSFPLVRTRPRNLYFTAGADVRKFRNAANGALESRYAMNRLSIGLIGNAFDGWGRGGTSEYSVGAVLGQVRLGTPDPGEDMELDGSFGKVRYAVSRSQLLTPTLSLYGALHGQFGTATLDSAERLYLGGPEGVRAYPVNDGSGNRSEVLTAELRWRALATLGLTAFADAGYIHDESTDRMMGAGVELTWDAPGRVRLQATWATRLGANPNPGPFGGYQDGSNSRNRWWLQASIPF